MSSTGILKAPEDTNQPQQATRQVTGTPDEHDGKLKHYLDTHILNRQDRPLYIAVVEGEGATDPLYHGPNVPGNQTVNHDFAPSGAFRVKSVSCGSTLDSTFKMQIRRGASGTYATKEVQFCVPARPNAFIEAENLVLQAGDAIRIEKRNRNPVTPTDLHSTIKGDYVV